MSSINICDENRRFWDELCGSNMAQAMGISLDCPESLHRYDAQYLSYYDYILPKIQPFIHSGLKTLEIGLGQGTLGQKLAEEGCDYLGMDIAEEPVKMMNNRMRLNGLSGHAVQRDFLDNGLEADSVDLFVSIGCLHHTGSLVRCVAEIERLLKPGGAAVIMVYNRFSYRQWLARPVDTLLALIAEGVGISKTAQGTEHFAGTYDTNSSGDEAPFTEFNSVSRLKQLFKGFRILSIEKENCADERFFGKTFLRPQIRPYLGRLCGLDLYITAVKEG